MSNVNADGTDWTEGGGTPDVLLNQLEIGLCGGLSLMVFGLPHRPLTIGIVVPLSPSGSRLVEQSLESVRFRGSRNVSSLTLT
jgi:hypothetical protein